MINEVIEECRESLKLPILDIYRGIEDYDEVNDQLNFIKNEKLGWIQAWNRDENAKDVINDPENHLFIPLIYFGKPTPVSTNFANTMKYIEKSDRVYMAGLSRLREGNKFYRHKDIDEEFVSPFGTMTISNTLLCGEGILELWNPNYTLYKHEIGKTIDYEPHIYHSAINTGKGDRVILMVNKFII